MKLISLIVSRPLSCSLFLAFAVFILPSLLIPCWFGMITRIHSHLLENNYNPQSEMQLIIEKMSMFLQPINSSATDLARVLSSSLNGTDQIYFSEIETKVAPILFEAFSTIPYLTEISYIGMDGVFFSYYTDKNQTFAVYSNSSFTHTNPNIVPHASKNYIWLTQAVNPNTGKLYGKVIETHALVTSNTSWFQEAFNSSHGYASIGTKWSSDGNRIFRNMARISGSNGVLSLGFSVEPFINFLSVAKREGASLYLATQEGEVLVEGLPNIKMVLAGSSASFLWFEPNSDKVDHIRNISCLPKDNINVDHACVSCALGTEFMLYCSTLEILGVQLVYALVFPQNRISSLVHKSSKVALILLILEIAINGISIFIFVFMVIRAAKREMHLCVKLIQQMEATQQAERKSMNKSVAFASASHDVRASLACIIGLIEICHDEAIRGSEMETNLKQMDACIKDLLGILNSILDTSKIEAGKVQLEEEEFDLGQLLEDVADLYHPVGMKKGVDIVLDPYDGSVIKFSQVKGDRGKLKQVLCNLMSNAVKFTSEGHVTLRAWVEKPSLQDKIIACNQNGLIKHFSFLFCKNKEAVEDLQAMDNGVQQKPKCMEFVIEVDDTGKGIPKEKQKSVFENYVQVKETALGEGGTGLGLGIVQSLVRLMRGDIIIMDKKIGEKGTCFRFNVFLTVCETVSNDNKQEDNSSSTDGTCQSRALNFQASLPNSRWTIQAPSPSLNFHSPSSKFAIRTTSPKTETSRVVLLIQDDQRRRVCRKFMESLGIKVRAVKQWENLLVALQKILDKQSDCYHSSRGKSEMSSPSDCLSKSTSCDSASGIKVNVPSGATGEANYLLSIFKKTNLKNGSSFILIVIDASVEPLREICRMMADFRRGLHGANCKVVWLNNPMLRITKYKENGTAIFDPNDIVISKPFHGSRLYQVVRILPEFGGTLQCRESKSFQSGNVIRDPNSSPYQSCRRLEMRNPPTVESKVLIGVQEETKANGETPKRKNLSPNRTQYLLDSESRISRFGGRQARHGEIQEIGNPNNEKPLLGKKILVAEDNAVLRKLAIANLSQLGATVELCENGEEASELVIKSLADQRKNSSSGAPYDYILMDCEMPIMDGYEATRQIRKAERFYNTRIPIIALTAHATGEEASKTIKAGMDVHLGKPLRREDLLKAIGYIHHK